MAGTWISFAGAACKSVVFRRSRGYGPDTSEVVLPAKSLASLGLKAPEVGALAKRAKVSPADVSAIQRGGAKAFVAPTAIPFEGTLELAHVGLGEELHRLRAPLFVADVEVVKADVRGEPVLVRLTLVDERHFWSRGVLTRWSFNRIRPGTSKLQLDSVGEDGKALTRAQIAERVTSALFRKPKLAASPERWADDRGPIELERYGFAVEALARLVREGGALEPCLRLDGEVAIHEAGDGKVAAAAGKDGDARGPNVTPIPVSLWKRGAGEVERTELGYPEDYVLVAGGEKITTVAVDDWEPVLVVKGKVWPLDDVHVKRLTSGKLSFEALRSWALGSTSEQGIPGASEAAVRLLRAQAFQRWRLPKVVNPDGTPGENARLLPLRPRAETEGGRRRPVTVETYVFRPAQITVRGPRAVQAQVDVVEAIKELARIRLAVERHPAFGRPRIDLSSPLTAGRAILEALEPTDDVSEISSEEVQRFVDHVRTVEEIRQVEPGFAQLYEAQLRRKFAAEDKASGGAQEALFDLAKAVDEFSRATESERKVARAGKLRGAREVLRGQLKKAQRALATARLKRERDAAAGVTPEGQAPLVHLVYENVLARTTDAGARVVDAEQGVIATSGIAGHLARELVQVPRDGGPLVLCPVRVVFGTVARPRVDVPPGKQATGKASESKPAAAKLEREETLLEQMLAGKAPELDKALEAAEAKARAARDGLPGPPPRVRTEDLAEADRTLTREREDVKARTHPLCSGGENVIPETLTDRETWYAAAFVRSGRGEAKTVELERLPFDQAHRIDRPDLVELVGLDGASNVATLNEAALALAKAAFRKAEVMTTTKRVLPHVWPIQCDGVVAAIEIRSREKSGAPCGFETTVWTGANAWALPTGLRTTARPGKPPKDGNVKREGLAP